MSRPTLGLAVSLLSLAFLPAGEHGHEMGTRGMPEGDEPHRVPASSATAKAWYAPCQRELPALAEAAAQIAGDSSIAFVLLPAREDPASARAWLAARGLLLPLYDPGAYSEGDEYLTLADGRTPADRELASVFPTTYVLDQRGIVLFAHRSQADNPATPASVSRPRNCSGNPSP